MWNRHIMRGWGEWLISSFTFLKNWSRVNLQCCINFCYIEKWFSYTLMHSFLKYSFPLCFNQGKVNTADLVYPLLLKRVDPERWREFFAERVDDWEEVGWNGWMCIQKLERQRDRGRGRRQGAWKAECRWGRMVVRDRRLAAVRWGGKPEKDASWGLWAWGCAPQGITLCDSLAEPSGKHVWLMLWSGRVFWWVWRNTKSCLKVGVKLPFAESFQNVLFTQVPPPSESALKEKQTTKCIWPGLMKPVLCSSRSRRWQVKLWVRVSICPTQEHSLNDEGTVLALFFPFVLLYDRTITCVWFEHLRVKHLQKFFLHNILLNKSQLLYLVLDWKIQTSNLFQSCKKSWLLWMYWIMAQ